MKLSCLSIHSVYQLHDQNITGRRLKTNFVEVRTFWHLFRSFERMWTFFILAFQVIFVLLVELSWLERHLHG